MQSIADVIWPHDLSTTRSFLRIIYIYMNACVRAFMYALNFDKYMYL